MNKIKFCICDDDVVFTEEFERFITEYLEKKNAKFEIVKFNDSKNVYEYCRKNRVDCLLLDIEMPGLTGFDLVTKLKLLPEKYIPEVVFVSARDELVFKSFPYTKYGFIRKNKMKDDIDEIMERFLVDFYKGNLMVELAREEVSCLAMKDVSYMENKGSILTAYDLEGNAYHCKNSIGVSEDKYRDYLIRIDQSHLVCAFAVRKIECQKVELIDGTVFKVSRRRWHSVQSQYIRIRRDNNV